MDYEQAKSEISRIADYFNNRRRHSSLHYMTPKQYYRENKIEKAEKLRIEINIKERKGGEMAETLS
jgi:hypothetical protein